MTPFLIILSCLVLMWVSFLGCGVKGPPLPPVPTVPQQTELPEGFPKNSPSDLPAGPAGG